MVELFLSIAEGAAVLFTFEHILLLVLGVILGVMVGAIPGFTSTNTIAILLPFMMKLSTAGALVFMAAIYAGSMCGGSIPSILFKIPGTDAAAVTALDGHPLAIQGKADYALGLATGGSFAGALIGSIIVIMIIQPMSRLALSFGPAEMFLLTLVGISVIATVSGDSLSKGMLSGAVGLLVAAMSSCPLWGVPRLTFGFFELYDEVPFVPVLIGLFAIPTVLELSQKEKIAEVDMESSKGSFSQIFKGIKDAFKKPITVLYSSLIGTFIGAVPGTGGTVATFVSYGQAKLWAKTKEERDSFGKGNPTGVIVAESANNAAASGALVPMITLGIPGSGTTAVMIALLMLQGITPGPHVIREHGPAVYALLVSLLIVPFVMVPVTVFFNRYASKVITIRSAYLVPALLVFCLVGAYAVRMYTFDFYIVIFIALLGILMNSTGYPTIPFVLGVILGPIAEDNVVRALGISMGDISIFYSSPLSKILILAMVLVTLLPIILHFKNKASTKSESMTN